MYMVCSLWCWQSVIPFHTHEFARWCDKSTFWLRRSDASIAKCILLSFLLRQRMAQILRCCVGWLRRRVASFQLIDFVKLYRKCNVPIRTRHLRWRAIAWCMYNCRISNKHVSTLHSMLVHHKTQLYVKICSSQKLEDRQRLCYKNQSYYYRTAQQTV